MAIFIMVRAVSVKQAPLFFSCRKKPLQDFQKVPEGTAANNKHTPVSSVHVQDFFPVFQQDHFQVKQKLKLKSGINFLYGRFIKSFTEV